MSNKSSRVKALYKLRYIRKIGILKYLVIGFSMMFAQNEYEVEWKGRCIYLRKGTSDITVFKQVMVFDQYAAKDPNKKKVRTIVDLGANIGLSSLNFSIKYPDARIIAVEPEKKNFDLMLKNVEGINNITCLNNAIWNRNSMLTLHDEGKGEYGYIVGEEPDRGFDKVKALTMDDIIEQFNIEKIDLLKIDIEGSEKELFASNYESWLPRVDRIIIELHDWYRPGCASSFFRAVSHAEYVMSVKGETLSVVFDKEAEAVYS
jgi:FkbM family methyltransferase